MHAARPSNDSLFRARFTSFWVHSWQAFPTHARGALAIPMPKCWGQH